MKNRFRIVILSTVAALVGTIVILTVGAHYVNVRIQESISMDDLVDNLYELRLLGKEYPENPSQRVRQQWRVVYARVEKGLAGEQGTPEDVLKGFGSLRQLFEGLASLPEKAPGIDASRKRLRNQLAIMLNVESQRIIDWANAVSREKRKKVVTHAMVAGMGILSVMFAAALIITGIIFYTTRRVLSSIVRLKEGTEQIARGKLGYQVEEAGNDEIGLLTGAINRMSSDLMDSYSKLHDQAAKLKTEMAERQAVLEALKASLKEKEVLLREVHHRVKNNMQVVSSLLNIQSSYLTDAKAADIFRASINRIKSMALIHDKLYQTTGLSRIDVSDYIQGLSRHLLGSYFAGSEVELNIDISPVSLDIDTVMPLGLLINELVTNSLKHAFCDARPGRINITLRENGGGQLSLTVSDNGIGIPEDLDYRNTQSMGMQLIMTLVDQLEGTMELERDMGARFRVTFLPGQEMPD